MGPRGVVALSSISGACLAAVTTLAILRAAEPPMDSFVSGSIPQSIPVAFVSPPAQFSVTNLVEMTVCLVERGGALTSRSRSFNAQEDCNAVWPGLANAENWTESGDGIVTLSDRNGVVVLTIGRGSGFSYEAVDVEGAELVWLLLP